MVANGGSATGGAGLGGAGNAGTGAAGSGTAGASPGGSGQGGTSGGTGANTAGAGGTAAAAGGTAAAAGGGAGAPYNPCPAAPADCKIMPFGDSITDGYLAQRGGYRIPLFQRAHQEGKHLTFVGSATNGPAMVDGVPFPQHHEGHSAYTIDDEPLPTPAHKGISPFVKTSIPAYRPDIVLLMIGTNDVDNSIDLPNVPTRLGALIDSIIALDAHTLIVVAQITPTMQDPLNTRIQSYNAAIPALIQSRAQAGKHVALVDMYSAFVADKSYRVTLMYDRLHPNIAGFQKMADTWNTVIHDLIH
jgi:lysophospholipase L1-like esterase